jgi:hypothetical protein
MALGVATSSARRLRVPGGGIDRMVQWLKLQLQDFW